MEIPTPASRARSSAPVSAEAIIGLGMTVAALGVLCLLLGLAEWMRLVRDVALVWLGLGAVLVLLGAVGAFLGQARKGRGRPVVLPDED